MDASRGSDISVLLRRLDSGEAGAQDELYARVWDELHRIAGAHLRRRDPDDTPQPAALVNEAWLLLTGRRPYAPDESSPLAVAKTVCEAVPPRPSAAVARADDGEAIAARRDTTRARVARRLAARDRHLLEMAREEIAECDEHLADG